MDTKLTVHEGSPVLRALADNATEAGRKEFLQFVATQAGEPLRDAAKRERPAVDGRRTA